jgi:hypothetical protein
VRAHSPGSLTASPPPPLPPSPSLPEGSRRGGNAFPTLHPAAARSAGRLADARGCPRGSACQPDRPVFFLPRMKCWDYRSRWGVFTHLAAALMLVIWLGAAALSASPGLHRLFHPDAQEPNHECAVTHVQQQWLLWTPATGMAAPPSALLLGRLAMADAGWPREADHRISPSRAPPLHGSPRGVAG